MVCLKISLIVSNARGCCSRLKRQEVADKEKKIKNESRTDKQHENTARSENLDCKWHFSHFTQGLKKSGCIQRQ